jgi:hypothetical protein
MFLEQILITFKYHHYSNFKMRKKRDYKKAMGWFIIVVMVLSVAGIIGSGLGGGGSSPELEYRDYNGYRIYESGLQSQVDISGRSYTFQYPPWLLEEINLPINVLTWLSKEKIYLGYNPEDNVTFDGQIQLFGSILYINNILPQQACTQDRGCGDIPIINCENDGVIFLSSTENVITKDNNCLILQADNQEIQRFTERLMYGFLGVIT